MALLDCFTWIPYLWVHRLVDIFIVRKEDKFISNLFPDDVAIEILVRLPADDVMKCRRLCRPWESLTSTPYFIERHLIGATPSLFVQVEDSDECDHFFICSEDAHKKLKYSEIDSSPLKKLNHYKPRLVLSSCDGLLLFEASLKTPKFFIVNPITQEQVSFDPPRVMPGGKLCAIFFHPSTKDYKVLYWECCHRFNYQYFTYSVGARTWKQISSFSSRPTTDVNSTVVLNGYLHWMVGHELNPGKNNAIMIYNINKEYFRVMPHPGHESQTNERNLFVRRNKMNLFKMNERLTFCRMRSQIMVIDIWVLMDYENWGWVKRYEVQLGWMENRFHSYFCCGHRRSSICFEELFPKRIKLLGIQNDELLFDWVGKGVFRYQLKLKRFKMDETMGLSRLCEHRGLTVAYAKSLVSPVNV